MEQWKDVIGYEGRYQISSHGRLKRVKRVTIDTLGRTCNFPERIAGGSINSDGYVIHRLENTVHKRANRLVAEAFIPNPENKEFVNHIDHNRVNDHVDNLEWVTRAENAMAASCYYLGSESNRAYKTKTGYCIIKNYDTKAEAEAALLSGT